MLSILRQYFPVRNMLFFFLEGCVIFSCFLLSTALLTFSNSYWFDLILILRILLITAILQTCLYYNDLYDFDIASQIPEIIIRLLQSLGVASILLACVYFLFPIVILDQKIYILSIFILIFFIIFWRVGYLHILNKGIFNQRIIILGSSKLAKDIYKKITNTIDCGYTVYAVIPDDLDKETDKLPENLVVDQKNETLCEISKAHNINKIIVALKEKRGRFPTQELIQCRTEGIDIISGSSFYELLTGKVLVREIEPSWLIFSKGFQKSWFKASMKRMQDIILSLILLTLLSPLLILVAILIKLDSKGPVLFSQDRVGGGKKEYMMHKFRSMVQDAEELTGPVWAGDNDNRITRVGRVIRKYRIDELPQLWEVLMGSMSLVGPRPERKYFTDQLEKEIPFYTQRFNVKPGLTGWAQVCYDYGATVEDAVEKLNYELFYIKNMSLVLDVVILLKTVKTVLFGKGAR
ncbi:capsular biosynthesis protein CpsE [Desulfobacter hydrogenophilus]|uniref:Capsular biosynthesis protein CpsE n=1 Tax=Desulfobacter hydrogenophilus TaxID=2291 RepID=A0A328FBM7_9BACT|nr:TIGR03013 family XrtA/PEP-CTERM system glycosyltransferase [Desulfobacter hydrogenophilus]NDY72431.1 TIGR03013 family PEP-CTERM/XrtA system glycosyltransferase [Desulfobacter hydrogenophilus]QBH13755.1 TIGR03013 family PEP-CTERM/XrtA system glycosyltransferase [Desulfobacter hydrogenophilus]RAM01699.1 capsular biosynthesis protein CpsE [Desulfobacter hydrogenophilus]